MAYVVKQLPTQDVERVIELGLEKGFVPVTILPALYAVAEDGATSFLAEVLVIFAEFPGAVAEAAGSDDADSGLDPAAEVGEPEDVVTPSENTVQAGA